MGDRIKFALLTLVALGAFATLGLIVYNFVRNDWRLEGNPLDISSILGEEEDLPPSARAVRTRTV